MHIVSPAQLKNFLDYGMGQYLHQVICLRDISARRNDASLLTLACNTWEIGQRGDWFCDFYEASAPLNDSRAIAQSLQVQENALRLLVLVVLLVLLLLRVIGRLGL